MLRLLFLTFLNSATFSRRSISAWRTTFCSANFSKAPSSISSPDESEEDAERLGGPFGLELGGPEGLALGGPDGPALGGPEGPALGGPDGPACMMGAVPP